MNNLICSVTLTFEEISGQLYENAGSLIIRESTNGPDFEVKTQGKKSKV
jgi:hypothetical protein